MDRITIRAFHAPDEPATCAEFLREHARVLEDFGIKSVLRSDPGWVKDKDCVVIVAEHDELGMVGGMRLEMAKAPGEHLPLLDSVGSLDHRVADLVNELADAGVCELCGLWNANRFAGRALPQVLGLVGISLANQVDARNLVGLLAKYTLKYALRLGFRIFDEVGHSGIFDYPRPGFLGIVCGTTDSLSMEHARPEHRRRIISLRLRPEQQFIENTGSTLLHVTYRLLLRENVIDLNSYRVIERDRLRYSA